MSGWRYPWAWRNCVGAWCPSRDRFRGSSILTDQSTVHNNGTLTNMDPPTDWILSPGAGGGYALDFDGSNDHVALGTWAGYSPEHMTISAWVRATVTPALYDGILGREETGSWLVGWGCYFTSATQVRFWVNTYSTSYAEATTPTYGEWFNLCGTWKINTQPQLYVNSTLGTSAGTSPASHTGTARPFRLGELGSSSYNFTGQLDDIRLYNRAMTPPEIAQLYRLGRGGAYQLKRNTIVKAGAAPATSLSPSLIHSFALPRSTNY